MVVLGILILFAAVAVMVVSGASSVERTNVTVEKAWKTSAYFEKGDRLRVYYVQGANWRLKPFLTRYDIPPEVGGYPYTKLIGIKITHPTGGDTYFSDVLVAPDEMHPEDKPLARAWLFVEKGQNESLIVDYTDFYNIKDTDVWRYKCESISGIVKYTGNYTVEVLEPFPPPLDPADPKKGADPPVSLTLIREREVYPYTHLLLPGAVTAIIGGAVIIYGATAKPAKRRVRKEKRR